MLNPGLDLRLFRYAIVSAERGSFRRAAAALNVQQPSVSKGVRMLEHRVGILLFERSHAGVRPTPAGEKFLREARLGFDHLERAMLGLARDLAQASRAKGEGRWRDGLGLGVELAGAKAGIVGLGRIGREIATRPTAMKMEVAWTGRRPQPEQPWRYMPDLVDLARWSDWLILTLPGSAETHGIIDRDVLEALGPQGRLVNIARGELVDETVLVDLLSSGGLGGAALDVFRNEPVRDGRWGTLGNVMLSPHIGTATQQTRRRMSALLIQGLEAHFRGKRPNNLVPECRGLV